MRTNSLAFRLVAGAAFWVVLGLAAGALLLSALFEDYVERSFDARLALILDGLVAASETMSPEAASPEAPNAGVRLANDPADERFGRPLSGWYWQIATGGKALLRSRSLWDGELAMRSNSDRAASDRAPRRDDIDGPDGKPIRILSRAITLPGSDALYFYAVAGDREEIARETASFNAALAWSLGGLGLVLVVAVFLQVRYGLGPLRRIPPALAAIRSGKARELAGDFPAEVEPLAVEINALLDHNREVVERARTHAGNLAHALKTPLAVLTNEAEASRGPLAETVKRQAEAMRRHAEHHLARARAAARGGALGEATALLPVIADLKRTLAAIHAARAVTIAIDCDAGAVFPGERQDIEEMLGNLMDNACKWARSAVRVRVVRELDRLVVTVEDDGQGLDATAREAALERGGRLDEAVPGSGLGLAIVRDLAALYEGDLALEDSALGGLRARLTLPAGA